MVKIATTSDAAIGAMISTIFGRNPAGIRAKTSRDPTKNRSESRRKLVRIQPKTGRDSAGLRFRPDYGWKRLNLTGQRRGPTTLVRQFLAGVGDAKDERTRCSVGAFVLASSVPIAIWPAIDRGSDRMRYPTIPRSIVGRIVARDAKDDVSDGQAEGAVAHTLRRIRQIRDIYIYIIIDHALPKLCLLGAHNAHSI